MTELFNKIKLQTATGNGNGERNSNFNKTITITSSFATSKTQVPVDVIDEKKEISSVDDEEIELPEYEKVKVVGRGTFSTMKFKCNMNSLERNNHFVDMQVHLALQFYM